MTLEEAFLVDILEHPDEDLPRQVFADWLEEQGDPDRAEFIRLQLTSARHTDQTAASSRASELLLIHWDRWVSPLARLVGPERYESWLRTDHHDPRALAHFSRGFVSSLTMNAARFLHTANELIRFAPLTRLRLHGAGGLGVRLAACRQLGWVRELDFIDYFQAPLEAGDMASLAISPNLGRLAVLRLHRNNLGDRGARALSRAIWLSGLSYLDLTENGLSSASLAHLADSPLLGNLRVLRLGGNYFEDADASRLVEASWFSRLVRLDLSDSGITEEAVQHLQHRAPRLHIDW